MSRTAAHFTILSLPCVLALAACDEARARECKDMISATAGLDEATPTSAGVSRIQQSLDPNKLEDKPLSEYATSLKTTLGILQGTLALKEGPEPPDGTDDVVSNKLKAARTIRGDIVKYCGP
jgi:hypothetical protein